MSSSPDILPIHADAYRILREVEDTHWWFDGMEDITRHLLRGIGLNDSQLEPNFAIRGRSPRQILDAGCGTGRNLRYLRGSGAVTGLDHSVDALEHCRARGFDRLVRGSVNEMPFANGQFDLVTCFDVLITDGVNDAAALPEFARVLRPGGHLFVRVAAYDWLRSHHDTEWAVTHRYKRAELRAKLTAAKLEVRVASYANTWLFPVALFKRCSERLRRSREQRSDLTLGAGQSKPARLLRRILASEARWIGGPGLPFGLSLIALARKPLR